MRDADGPIAATITAHHLLYNRNAIFMTADGRAGMRPHYYCLPVLKREAHRLSLLEAATSGSPRYFLGTDSAPHPKGEKESACGCAGCYTALHALELYAEAFDSAGQLDRLEGLKLHLPIILHLNDRLLGRPNAGVDMTFDFGQMIAHVTRTRRLGAGAIVGSGTISNCDRSLGSCCLAELRMLETLARGTPATPFMKFGDTVRIEMFDAGGQSVFGAIEQRVVSPGKGKR